MKPTSTCIDELHAFSDNVRTCVFDQQMNVIGRHHVIEHAQTETLLRFKEQSAGSDGDHAQTFLTEALGLNGLNGATRLIERLKLIATLVSDVPNMVGQIVAVSAWHRFLRGRFFDSTSHF